MTSLETYLQEMRNARPVAVNESSYYIPPANLFNTVSRMLKPSHRIVTSSV